MVASAQPGTRNNTLNTAAFNLFQIVAGGELDEQEVRDRLFEAAEACGLVADDGAASVEATIDSARAGRHARSRAPDRSRGRSEQVRARPFRSSRGELPRIVNETEDALLASGVPIFSRAGMLVEPVAESMPAADGRKTVVAQLRGVRPSIPCWSRSPRPRSSRGSTASASLGRHRSAAAARAHDPRDATAGRSRA